MACPRSRTSAATVMRNVTCGAGIVPAMILTMASVAENTKKARRTSTAPRPLDGTTGAPPSSIPDASADIETAEPFLDAGLRIFEADRQNPVDHGSGYQHFDMTEFGLALGAGKIHDFPDAHHGD